MLVPFAEQAGRLRTIPGIGKRTAEVVIAEIGVDMARFPTAAAPGVMGRAVSRATTSPPANTAPARPAKATPRSAPRCCEAAWSAARTRDTYLAAQFRRFCRRFGKKGEGKAIFAVAHTMIVIIWHVLHDEVDYQDLGADYFSGHDNPDATQTPPRPRAAIHGIPDHHHTSRLNPTTTHSPVFNHTPELTRDPRVGFACHLTI